MKTWLARLGWPLLGFAGAGLLWQLGAGHLSDVEAINQAFSPQAGLSTLVALLGEASFWGHIVTSLQRVGLALAGALLIGLSLGLLTGMSPRFARITGTLFQFLRMVSPLSWMPLAVMALGLGDGAVVFLLVFAGVWPIVLNTAAGVAALDRHWLQLAASLSATRWELINRVVLPGILAHVLTGFRLALGVAWIVLVPAEMLGVSSGLGYFILDARDRLAYQELTAAIVVIGALGFALDSLARTLIRRWTHAGPGQQ